MILCDNDIIIITIFSTLSGFLSCLSILTELIIHKDLKQNLLSVDFLQGSIKISQDDNDK